MEKELVNKIIEEIKEDTSNTLQDKEISKALIKLIKKNPDYTLELVKELSAVMSIYGKALAKNSTDTEKYRNQYNSTSDKLYSICKYMNVNPAGMFAFTRIVDNLKSYGTEQ